MLHMRPAPLLLLPRDPFPPAPRPAAVPPTVSLFSCESADGPFLPQANEIISRVYLSDLSTAQSRLTISNLGITHVLSVMPGSVELPYDMFVKTMQVPIADMPFADLLSHLEHTSSFIQEALNSSPSARVLVHCAKGRSRSCSVVAAHLIASRGYTVAQAVEHIQSRRRIAMPNFGFMHQLQEYHDMTRPAVVSIEPVALVKFSV